MSLITEIHRQPSSVRFALFALSAIITVSVAAVVLYSSIQKDVFFATHPDSEEQQAFLAQRAQERPQILAAVAKAADTLAANIGSLIGWDRTAGFDRGGEQDTMRGGVHLLPESE